METNLAVLIDFENIAAGTEKDGLGRFDVELVLARLSDKGRVLIARSYADWGRFARFKQGLLTNNVSMMELTSHGMQDKNRADIALVVEGMELAFTKPYIDTFVVVSGDSDFTPLVLKMRELDKRVIGCGCRSSTSRLLIQACDEFIFYDNLVKRKKSRREKSSGRSRGKSGELTLDAAFELLNDALEGLQRENPDPALAGVVKSAMLRKSPDFSESDLGFSTFGRFLEKARKAGQIQLTRDEKSGGYRVDQPGPGATNGGSDDSGDKGRASSGGSSSDDGEWLDPYLPEGTESYVAMLTAEDLNPPAAPTRKTVLQAIEEIVERRSKKKRRVTVQFVQDDVRRQLRKTHPDLPNRGVRQVFNGLMRAGVFIHRDGTPVRTGSAPFTLSKTAEELNDTLADIYVDELLRGGADLDVGKLADLFYGDPSNTRPVEESIAYHQAQLAEDDDTDDDGKSDDLDDLDVDSLLVADDDDDDAKDEARPARKRSRKRSSKKASAKDEADSKSDDDAKADDDSKDDDDAPSTKKASKKTTKKSAKKASKKTTKKSAKKASKKTAKTSSKKSSKTSTEKAEAKLAEVAEKAAADDKDDEAEDDGKPKKRRVRRKRSTKKASADDGDKAETKGDDDLDSLLSED